MPKMYKVWKDVQVLVPKISHLLGVSNLKGFIYAEGFETTLMQKLISLDLDG